MAATPPNLNPDPTFDLERIAARLRANLRVVLGCLLLALAIGLGYTFFSVPKYEARATLFFPVRLPSVIPSSGITDASASQSLLGTGPSPLKIFRAFLESQTALDYVSGQSGMERQKVVDVRSFTEDSAASTLTVSIVLPDKDLGEKLLDYHIEALGQINTVVSEKYVRDESQTLQAEVKRRRRDMREADRKLKEFEQTTVTAPQVGANPTSPTVINKWQEQLDTTRVKLNSANASIEKASERFRAAAGAGGSDPVDIPPVKRLRPQLRDAEVDLEFLRKSLGEDAPQVRQQRAKVDVLQKELRGEAKKYLASVNKGLFDPTDSTPSNPDVTGLVLHQVALEAEVKALTALSNLAPTESSKLTSLTREVAIDTELVIEANKQLEMAKLLALRDPNKWSLLDPPRIMEKPVNKRYGMMAAACTAAGLIVGIIWAMNFGRRPD